MFAQGQLAYVKLPLVSDDVFDTDTILMKLKYISK